MKLNVASCILFASLVEYSSQYIKLNVENDDLCSHIKKRKVRLEKSSNSGLIVTTTRLNDHSIDWNTNFKCKFQITPSSSREGIIAVIQDLSFRKNSTPDECVDYIQFGRKDGSTSQKFCGSFNAATRMDHNFATEAVSPTFVDGKGELDIVISVSKEYLKHDEKTNFTIVFTAYRHCSQVLKRDTTYRPCSVERKEFCIYSGFFMDSYINCPFPDCEDEEGCSKTEVIDYYYGNKVLIGAVSSVFVVFALFILFLWFCKTYKIFCWSQNFANPSATPENQATEAPRVIEMNEQTDPRSSASQANNSSANPIDEDKDLPPSYESLFPPR